jgi:error-prone DNA polymerase
MGFYSLDVLGRDANRHGVEVRLPDINKSDVYCTVEDGTVRVGFGFLRDWGMDIAEEVVLERERNGPFLYLADFVRRAPARLSRTAIENVVWVGGCDSFGLTRRELLWQVGLWLPPKTEKPERNRVRRQLELPLTHPYERMRFSDVPDDERILAEYEMMGFAASAHPFALLAEVLPPNVVRSDQLDRLEEDADVQVAGLVVARQRPETAKGYSFILLEDQAGMMNAIVRPDIYDRDRITIRTEPYLWIVGKLAKDDGTVNILTEEVRPLQLRKQAVKEQPGATYSQSPYKFLKDLRRGRSRSRDWF